MTLLCFLMAKISCMTQSKSVISHEQARSAVEMGGGWRRLTPAQITGVRLCCVYIFFLFLGSKCKGKGEGKVLPITGLEDPEGEQRYSSTLSLSSALDGGVDVQRHVPSALPPVKTRYPLYRMLCGLQVVPLFFDRTDQPFRSKPKSLCN